MVVAARTTQVRRCLHAGREPRCKQFHVASTFFKIARDPTSKPIVAASALNGAALDAGFNVIFWNGICKALFVFPLFTTTQDTIRIVGRIPMNGFHTMVFEFTGFDQIERYVAPHRTIVAGPTTQVGLKTRGGGFDAVGKPCQPAFKPQIIHRISNGRAFELIDDIAQPSSIVVQCRGIGMGSIGDRRAIFVFPTAVVKNRWYIRWNWTQNVQFSALRLGGRYPLQRRTRRRGVPGPRASAVAPTTVVFLWISIHFGPHSFRGTATTAIGTAPSRFAQTTFTSWMPTDAVVFDTVKRHERTAVGQGNGTIDVPTSC